MTRIAPRADIGPVAPRPRFPMWPLDAKQVTLSTATVIVKKTGERLSAAIVVVEFHP